MRLFLALGALALAPTSASAIPSASPSATATRPARQPATKGAKLPDDALPDGVEQLLPRGRIAAVFEPDFVPASKADIADDAWILGVEIDGTAHAYSLNLLNAHEIVNDQIGDKTFAAVW